MNSKLSLLLLAALIGSAVGAQADVLIANRFNNNVLRSDATGLSGWTAFATFGTNQPRAVASDGTNVFVMDNANNVYSYNSTGTQTGVHAAAGGVGRLTYVLGTAGFNGLVQAGSDNNVRRYGSAPVTTPITTASISWSPGAAPYARTIGGTDYLLTPGGGNSVRRNSINGSGVLGSNESFQLQAQTVAFSQVHFAFAPNGDQFFGGSITTGSTVGGLYLANSVNFGTLANGSIHSAGASDLKISFANAAPSITDPGIGSVRDMAFDPYSDTGVTASFYILNDSRLFKYTYTYADKSFAFVNSTTGGAGGLAINQGLQLAFTPIPEPSSFAALAGLGAIGLVGLRRRRRA